MKKFNREVITVEKVHIEDIERFDDGYGLALSGMGRNRYLEILYDSEEERFLSDLREDLYIIAVADWIIGLVSKDFEFQKVDSYVYGRARCVIDHYTTEYMKSNYGVEDEELEDVLVGYAKECIICESAVEEKKLMNIPMGIAI